jgi:acyl transferase domain-containing protein/SAM-dependent methyltransferase/acyl carrier protein
MQGKGEWQILREKAEQMNKKYADINPNAIAIIGISCRFPGAKNIDEFWHNLKNGIESISYFSEDEVVKSGIDIESVKNPSLVKAFGVLEDSDKFDAEFFGFSPREAELLDPQNRIFLECAWEAIENAAYDTDRIDGRVGVYASSSLSSYLLKNLLSNKEQLISVGGMFAQLGNDKDHVPTRVSYAMNLKGPSISIGTACSSSLVAVHLACQGLLDYHCDMALAGGVTVHANQVAGYYYHPEGTASPDGHCRTFDSNSGGTISGCGAGVVVLKRLEDAVRDNDNIYAIVLSSAVNNDGSIKVSYTAPGIDGQSEVIAEVHNLADINPGTITYVETHGTATKLGDSIEIAALKKVFSLVKNDKSFCAIGSVKSNFGHLDSAAGIAGFIKTVLALKNKQIPPSIHFENQNSSLNIDGSPFYVNNKLTEWTTDGIPRRAGVSSFAMGGTNAHVILQEAEEYTPYEPENKTCVVPISAKTENALIKYSQNLLEELNIKGKLLNDVTYTFQMGRKPFKYRKAIVVNSMSGLLKELEPGKSSSTYTGTADSSNTDIVFMFSGLGSHYINMGLNLFNNNKTFRDSLIRCSDIFSNVTGEDLLSIIYPDGTEEKKQVKENAGIDFLKMVRSDEEESKSENKIDKTIYAHPAIFSIEYALAQMCFDLGFKPSALIGHSIGEYTALCISGALNLEDILKLIIKRARILETAQEGGMLTVDTKEENINKYLTLSLSIAAVNDSSSCVVAGLKKDIELLKNKMDAAGIVHRSVKTQHAFHSKLLEEKKNELKTIFAGVHFNKIEFPIISGLTGDWLTEEEITNPDYWVSHTIKAVRFFNGIQKLLDENYKHFLEIGPGQNLAGFVLKSITKAEGRKIHVQTTMKNLYDDQPDYEYFMRTIAKLWTTGINIQWESFYREQKPRRVPLPTYPFENKRYWIDEKTSEDDIPSGNEKRGISYLTWKKSFSRIPSFENVEGNSNWLIFREPCINIDNLTEVMKEKGIKFVTVLLSNKNEIVNTNEYALNTYNKNCFELFFDELGKNNIKYKNIVYVPSSNTKESGLEQSRRDVMLITGLLKVLSLSNTNVNLSFLLENAFNITGSEIVNLANAALYGLIKSIPDEYKAIKTYCFETGHLSSNNQKDYYYNVIRDVLTEADENVVAFRGKSRWVPDYNQLSVSKKYNDDDKPEKFLVSGNNFKLKKTIVDELNGKNNKQIITGIENLENGHNKNHVDFISLIEKQIDKQLSIKSIDDYEGLRNKLDRLCGVMAAGFLSHYFEWKVGKEYLLEMLHSKIKAKHNKFLNYLLRVAAEDNYIAIVNDKIEIRKDLNKISIQGIEAEKIKKQYPQFAGIINILEYSVSTYQDVFSGKMENVDVFFDRESEIFGDIFHESPLRCGKQDIYINTVRELINHILDKSPARKIHILEVGGGTGKLTGNIMADLIDKNIEYHFTDIGKSFVVDAIKWSNQFNIDFMKFDKFDISQAPQKQGVELSKYDIVLAYDVIHATENIEDAMKNLEMVTADGGIMIIIEAVQPGRWANMSWGLQTGWWYFNDFRNTGMSPLITLNDWDKILSEFDMSFSATYPLEEPRRSNTAFGLIVAQKRGEGNQSIIDIHSLNKILGAELKDDSANIEDYNSYVAELIKEFRKIKREHGQVNSIYLCQNNSGSIPIILRDYDHHKDAVESRINNINMFITSIKESGLLKGRLNILFEKSKVCFHADESIVSEYINALASETDFEITSIYVDKDYFNSPNEMQITDAVAKISSTQIYITPGEYGGKKDTQKKQPVNENNIYSRPNLSNDYTEPRNDTERKLVEIWKVMFGIDKVGIEDNFIELGGDSLMATKIITRINQELNILVKLPVFFQNPTIEAIAENITSNKNMLNKLTSELEISIGEREEGEI